ncbi:MAG: sigma factor [Chloroflexota bacterium]|nr:sigma factor [Chloroflexota bacterium]
MTTLEQMEPDVRRLAQRFTRDRPDAQEDLAQVARLAMWQELCRRPDAPEPLLVRVAERAMIGEGRQGHSVDGRLFLSARRAHTWTLQSMDAPQRESQAPLTDVLASGPVHAHNLWESPTEADAMGRVLYEMLREMLTPQEDAVLTLLLVGYWNREIERQLDLTEKQVRRARSSLQRQVAMLVEADVALYGDHAQEAARRAVQARRGRPKPYHVPIAMAALLTELLEVIRQC